MSKIVLKDPINHLIEGRPIYPEGRGYLGISQLGHECDRCLWYVVQNAPRDHVTPRTIRIWERGSWEEARIISDLETIGCTVTDTQSEVELSIPEAKCKVLGHCDAVVHNLPTDPDYPHLLEIKTAADTSFSKFRSSGIKKANYQYWLQAQLYAVLMGIPKILFVVVNKNDESRYFETFKAEPAVLFPIQVRVAEIMLTEEAPEKIGNGHSDFFTCRMCSFRTVCHG